MLFEDLREWIKRDIDDPSFDNGFIDRLINSGIRTVAARVLLPVLQRDGEVKSSGSEYIDLPADFGHNLFHAATHAGAIRIYSNLALLTREFPTFGAEQRAGRIKACAVCGKKIAIVDIPLNETVITLHYYAFPQVLGDGDSLDWFLDEEDQDLLFHFAMWRLHKMLEDGIDGAQNNTSYHKQLFDRGLVDMEIKTSQGQSRPAPIRKSYMI